MLNFNLTSYLKIKITLLQCDLHPDKSKIDEICQAQLQLIQSLRKDMK